MTKPKVITITACGRSYGKATAVLKWWESLSPVERRMARETLFRTHPRSATHERPRAGPRSREQN